MMLSNRGCVVTVLAISPEWCVEGRTLHFVSIAHGGHGGLSPPYRFGGPQLQPLLHLQPMSPRRPEPGPLNTGPLNPHQPCTVHRELSTHHELL